MSPGFSPDLGKLLREQFRLQEFKPGQREAIEAVLAGRRVLLVQPTGWGKSLVYQMIAAVRGLTVVFTPLRALMRDQVKNAGRYGLRAALLNSDQSPEEQEAALREAAEGRLELLFIAPERLDNALWKAHVPRLPIRAVVVDEAHCISVWGHDFRPDYRRIVNLVRLLPAATPVLAVTATATSRVEADILAQIGEATELLRGPLVRPNFVLRVVRVVGESDKLAWLAHLVQQYEGTGLVYCASRPMTELVAEYLNSVGIKAEYYHAGRDERSQLERALMENRYKVIAATNALGMGLDKPDLRFVIHTEFPASPLHYYQEIGRAGRDGQRADLVLLYDPADQAIQQRFIDGNKPAAEAYRQVYELLMQKSLREREILLETGLSQTAWRNIRSDLEDQNALIRDEDGFFRARPGVELDFSLHDRLRSAKQEELAAILRVCPDWRVPDGLPAPLPRRCGRRALRQMRQLRGSGLEQAFRYPASASTGTCPQPSPSHFKQVCETTHLRRGLCARLLHGHPDRSRDSHRQVRRGRNTAGLAGGGLGKADTA